MKEFKTGQGTEAPSFLWLPLSLFFCLSLTIYIFLPLSLCFFLALSIQLYLLVFLFLCPSLSDSVSPLFYPISLLVILSFLLYFPHISVFLPLLLDLCGCVSWSHHLPLFVLFSFPSQSPQGLLKKLSCYILGFFSRGVRDGDLRLNLNFSGLGGALQREN